MMVSARRRVLAVGVRTGQNVSSRYDEIGQKSDRAAPIPGAPSLFLFSTEPHPYHLPKQS